MEPSTGLSYEFQKKVHIVSYLADKFADSEISIIKAIKLLFLADVYALRKYGTTITEDNYFAMKNGPVASEMCNIIDQSDEWLGTPEKLKYIQEYLQREPGDTRSKFSSVGKTDEGYLSKIDKEAIDYAVKEFGEKSEDDLIDITHKFKAWSKRGEKLSADKKREEMDMADIFENDGEIRVSPKVLAGSKVLYGGV